jgi:D-lactate dehydrogenase
MKIGFFEIKDWEANYLKEKLATHDLYFSPNLIDAAHLPTEKDFQVVSVFTDSKIDSKVLAAFPKLKLVATRTTGIDHIDQEALKKREITLKNVPTYGSNTVAEFTFALLLNYSRKISSSLETVKEGGNFSTDGLQGFDLLYKTLGVVGTGNIGRQVIRIANGFGMKVIAYDVQPDNSLERQLNFRFTSFENLLNQSDIITLHVPYLPTTHHLINENNISQIKRGAVLINTARGAIVETKALVKALQEGILAAALLDVLEEETLLKNERRFILEKELPDEDLKTLLENHVLIDMDNVYITPHNAFNTKEALIRILDTTIENIQNLASTEHIKRK